LAVSPERSEVSCSWCAFLGTRGSRVTSPVILRVESDAVMDTMASSCFIRSFCTTLVLCRVPVAGFEILAGWVSVGDVVLACRVLCPVRGRPRRRGVPETVSSFCVAEAASTDPISSCSASASEIGIPGTPLGSNSTGGVGSGDASAVGVGGGIDSSASISDGENSMSFGCTGEGEGDSCRHFQPGLSVSS
jgi:hypothetical protein